MIFKRRLSYTLLVTIGTIYGLSAFSHTGLNASAADLTSLTITDRNGKSTILTESEILSLTPNSITTSTAWTEGAHLFEGVRLQDVLEKAGITVEQPNETTLNAIAHNEYQVAVPYTDARDYQVLIAASMDGKRLTLRDKGPYWLIYPRDDRSELQDSRFDHRWAWQLKELQIK